MEKFERLKQVLENASADVEKTSRGNKAAGVRVRKALQEVRTLAYDLRKEISALSKGE